MSKQPMYEPECIYHIFNHANGQEDMFKELENYNYFLRKYAEKLNEVVTSLAYCLMPNHFHLLIRVKPETELLDFLEKKKGKLKALKIPDGLSGKELNHFIVKRQFHNFLGGYSKAFNKYHNRKGSLLRQNTKRKMVNEERYLTNAIRYLHLNPVFHGFTLLPEEWQHSSFNIFLNDCDTKIPKNEILEWFGGVGGFIRFHKERLEYDLIPQLER